MGVDPKKTALRMIPYGLYVLMAKAKDGTVVAATVSWVTQASFKPLLLAVGVRVDSRIHTAIKDTGAFALNILGKGQQEIASKFFKSAEREGETIAGEPFREGVTGSPLLESTPAALECTVVDAVEQGDHAVFIAEVIEAYVSQQPQGRPDESILWLKDLGENIFYGG